MCYTESRNKKIGGISMKTATLKCYYHWYRVQVLRKKGNRLIAQGEPLTSRRLLKVSHAITEHGLKAIAYEEQVYPIALSV